MANLPNFLYVGTDKAGSTFIYEILRAHPDCFVPRAKDIYYFDKNYERGPAWYARFFADAAGKACIGELSHDYLHSRAGALRIRKDLGAIRIIISIREPVSRAFSNYLFLLRHGISCGTFQEAASRFPEIIEWSLYAEPLARYIDLFGSRNVHVILFDDIRSRPADVQRRLFEFLALDPSAAKPIDLKKPVLPAARPRVKVIAKLAKAGAVASRRLGLVNLIGTVKSSPLVQRVLYSPYKSYPQVTDADRAYFRGFFRQDIERTSALLGLDLGHWLDQKDAPAEQVSRVSSAQLNRLGEPDDHRHQNRLST